MSDTGLPDASFDGVWCCASLLNVKKQDVPSTLAEFKRILRTGGSLFISVKEGDTEGMVQDKEGRRYFSYFTKDELQTFVEGAGFTVSSINVVPDKDFTGEDTDNNWICLLATI